MSDRPAARTVVVVGGGALGASTAAHLAERGADVVLVTEAALASGASGRSLSWLNSYGERSQAYHQLRLAGLARYRALATRVDDAAPLRFDGGLTWAGPDRLERMRSAFEHMQAIGYSAEWLTRAQVAGRTPGVAPAAVPESGAVLNADEGWVDLPWLVHHLARAVSDRGGRVVEHAGVVEVQVAGDRVTGVRTASGDVLGADDVVLATGAGVPVTVSQWGLDLPEATPTALLVRTAPVATTLRAVLNTPRVAMRPAPGGSLVMDAGWSEREVVTHPDGRVEVHESTVQGLLREASAVLDGHPSLTVESCGVGPKPVPGDGEPVLGEVPGVAGLHVAFTHSGATLALVAGDLLAGEVLGGAPSPMLAAFRPSRFL